VDAEDAEEKRVFMIFSTALHCVHSVLCDKSLI